jgi:hypothetical protein
MVGAWQAYSLSSSNVSTFGFLCSNQLYMIRCLMDDIDHRHAWMDLPYSNELHNQECCSLGKTVCFADLHPYETCCMCFLLLW